MIKGLFYIEAQGTREEAVKGSLGELMRQLKEEDKIRVEREKYEEVLAEDGRYSSMVEVELVFQDFLTYLLAAIKYGPSAILILKPEKLLLDRRELLEALGEVIRITRDFFEKHRIGYKYYSSAKGKAEVGLTQEEIEKLLEEGAIRTKIVVEARGKSRQRAVREFLDAISEDVFVNRVRTRALSKTKESRGFEGLIGVEAFMHEPKTLFDLAVKHRPVLVELLEPEEIELDMLEIQDIGVDLAGVFFEASHMLLLK